MTFKLDIGPAPADLYQQGVTDGRKASASHKYTMAETTALTEKLRSKKDEYTRGFVAGITERAWHD